MSPLPSRWKRDELKTSTVSSPGPRPCPHLLSCLHSRLVGQTSSQLKELSLRGCLECISRQLTARILTLGYLVLSPRAGGWKRPITFTICSSSGIHFKGKQNVCEDFCIQRQLMLTQDPKLLANEGMMYSVCSVLRKQPQKILHLLKKKKKNVSLQPLNMSLEFTVLKGWLRS